MLKNMFVTVHSVRNGDEKKKKRMQHKKQQIREMGNCRVCFDFIYMLYATNVHHWLALDTISFISTRFIPRLGPNAKWNGTEKAKEIQRGEHESAEDCTSVEV